MKKLKIWQWILIILFIFIVIGIITPTEKTCPVCEYETITKEVIKEIPINQDEINKLKKQISIQKQIMDIDDKAFIKASEITTELTNSLINVYNHDDYGMLKSSENIDKITKQLNKFGIQKNKLKLELNGL